MLECFALSEGRCTVLVVRECQGEECQGEECQGEECPFYKTPEQYVADQQQALERIYSLGPELREYLLAKYHGGEESEGVADEGEGVSGAGSLVRREDKQEVTSG